MKRSDKLKLDKANKIKRMQEIVAAAEGANSRALTTEEKTEWDNLDGEVKNLTTEIHRAARMEELGANPRAKKPVREEEEDEEEEEEEEEGARFQKHGNFQIQKRAKAYSVGKAIREFARGGEQTLTGIEKEQHVELARGIVSEGLLVPYHHRDVNTTTHATSIDVVIDPNLSIIGKKPLWSQMGMTVLPGLQGQIKLGKKTADVAGKFAEKEAVNINTSAPSYITLSPERYGMTDIFTKEVLGQANPAVQAAIINDMIAGCDRKLTAEAYTVALAAATEVATGALSKNGFDALMGAVDLDGAFAMTRASFFAAKGVKIDAGSGLFLASLTGENGIGVTYDGAKIIYSTLFADGANKQYAIYGGWSEMYVGFWGALEILLNPYTYQKTGQIEMTVNRLADVACRNTAAFVRTPDLDETT